MSAHSSCFCLQPPPAECLLQGLELLYALGGKAPFVFWHLAVRFQNSPLPLSLPPRVALNDKGDLTDPLGLRMAEFPLNPMFARMLLMSGQLGSQHLQFIAHGNAVVCGVPSPHYHWL